MGASRELSERGRYLSVTIITAITFSWIAGSFVYLIIGIPADRITAIEICNFGIFPSLLLVPNILVILMVSDPKNKTDRYSQASRRITQKPAQQIDNMSLDQRYQLNEEKMVLVDRIQRDGKRYNHELMKFRRIISQFESSNDMKSIHKEVHMLRSNLDEELLLSTPIDEISFGKQFDVRIQNSFKRANVNQKFAIFYIKDLVSLNKKELHLIEGIGETSIRAIESFLKSRGLQLGMHVPGNEERDSNN